MKIFKMYLAVGVLFLGMSAANAQASTTPPAEVRANAYTTTLTNLLQLTPDQIVKMEELNLGIAMKNDGIRANTTFTAQQKADIFQSNNAARLERYAYFLTPAQLQAVQVYEAELAANGQSNNL